ncbi:hypothetical protein ACN47E_002227 [Coniothyrium glycines]
MQIVNGPSHPIDPEAPSFLTTLPPEVRNIVYKILFHRGDVLIHNTGAYHAEEPSRADYAEEEEFHWRMSRYYDHVENEIGADCEFNHKFHLGLPLLRTCRQIFHESASILYGGNKFIISRTTSLHDFDCEDFHDSKAYCQLTYGPVWLSRLGSLLQFLRSVSIDVDALCPPACSMSMMVNQEVELLPLLRIIWRNLGSPCRIGFVRTGRTIHGHLNQKSYLSDKLEALNNILQSFGVRDTLKLKQYAGSSRLVDSITVSESMAKGNIAFSPALMSIRQTVVISNNGSCLDYQPTSSKATIKTLPNVIKCNILKHAANLPDDIEVDLEAKRIYGMSTSFIRMAQTVMCGGHSTDGFLLMKHATIRVNSKVPATDFNGFANFMDLPNWSRRLNASSRKVGPPSWGFLPLSLTISMEFDLAEVCTLKELRIDLIGLIEFLKDRKFTWDTTLQVVLKHPGYEEGAILPLETMQKTMFLVLSDMIESADYLRGQYYDALSSLIINGHGRIIHAGFLNGVTGITDYISNRHHSLRGDQILMRGSCMIRDINPYFEDNAFPRRKWTHILRVWHALRTGFWPE